MIRKATFAILAIIVALGVVLLTHPGWGEWETVLLFALIIVAWLGIYDVCDRGRFAGYLGKVDEETKEIAWPNRVHLFQGVMIVVSLLAVLAIAFCFIDTLITYLLYIYR